MKKGEMNEGGEEAERRGKEGKERGGGEQGIVKEGGWDGIVKKRANLQNTIQKD